MELYNSSTYQCEKGYDSGDVDTDCVHAFEWYSTPKGTWKQGAGICLVGPSGDPNMYDHAWFIPLLNTSIDINNPATMVFTQLYMREQVYSNHSNCQFVPPSIIAEKGIRTSDNLPFVKITMAMPGANKSAEQWGVGDTAPDLHKWGINIMVIGPEKP